MIHGTSAAILDEIFGGSRRSDLIFLKGASGEAAADLLIAVNRGNHDNFI